ncbi:MAG: DMT family transporter [Pseudomonadota bacterium]
MSRTRATSIGFGAVLLWATLALFTVGASDIPPFQLTALCFGLAGVLGLIWMAATGRKPGRLPLRVWAIGVLGLFGYHALYFTALQNAPPAEAGLIAYLWPLLIVIFSGLLPGEALKARHLIGAVIAGSGAALILIGGGVSFSGGFATGYLAAIACAFVWSGYSVLSRVVGDIPTEAVAYFCLATAALSAATHLFLETTVWPSDTLGWASVAALGLGPVGLAFFLWDIGVKHGDIQLLGTTSYAAPLLSTLILVGVGAAPLTLTLALAAILITGGAVIAAGVFSNDQA